MKKLLFILLVLMLTSCATAFQQIASISSPQMRLTDNGHFAYSEDDLVVDYNFWAQNGQVSFVITNNMDKDVYVDLGRSFLVVNGMTFDYFQNRTYSTNASSTVVSSSAYGASNTFALSAGMANAFASSYGGTAYGVSYGSSAGSSRTSASSHRTTSSSTVNRGVEYKEKEGVWIPAHSSRHFCEFSLLEVPYRQCGFARNPSKKEDMTLTFSEENSPYAFDNVLMFVVEGADRRVVNSFYVSALTNIQQTETYEEEELRNCDDSKTGETIRIYKFRSANRFFINYYFNSMSNGSGTDRLKKGAAVQPKATVTKKPADRKIKSANKKAGKKENRNFDDGLYQ